MPVKIGYSLDEKTKTTYAFVKSASEYPDGINWHLIMGLDNMGFMKEKDYRLTHDRLKGLTSKAVCSSEDKFDEKIGRQVARDKLLRRYYEFCNTALNKYMLALDQAAYTAYGAMKKSGERYNDICVRLVKAKV